MVCACTLIQQRQLSCVGCSLLAASLEGGDNFTAPCDKLLVLSCSSSPSNDFPAFALLCISVHSYAFVSNEVYEYITVYQRINKTLINEKTSVLLCTANI